MSLVSSMIPLFVFITLPGVCPSTLGFKNYLILENQQVKVTWEEFFKVVGIKKAIKLANCFYAYFYAYSASPSKRLGGSALINVDGHLMITVDGFGFKVRSKPSITTRLKTWFSSLL